MTFVRRLVAVTSWLLYQQEGQDEHSAQLEELTKEVARIVKIFGLESADVERWRTVSNASARHETPHSTHALRTPLRARTLLCTRRALHAALQSPSPLLAAQRRSDYRNGCNVPLAMCSVSVVVVSDDHCLLTCSLLRAERCGLTFDILASSHVRTCEGCWSKSNVPDEQSGAPVAIAALKRCGSRCNFCGCRWLSLV